MIPHFKDISNDETFVNAMVDAIVSNIRFLLLDKQFNIVWANKQFCELIKSSDKYLIGKPIEKLDFLFDGQVIRNTILPALSEGDKWSGEMKCHAIDGSPVWLSAHFVPVHWSQDVDAYLFLGADITARKNLQEEKFASVEALRENEARYRALVENQSDIISMFKANGDRIYVNESYSRFTGKKADELVGTNIMEFALKGVPQWFLKKLFLLTPEHPELSHVFEVENAAHQKQWVLLYVKGIFDSFGNLVEFMSIGRNVTEMKTAEIRQSDYIEALERISFMTSHRIRSPIATMLGLLELLRINALDADQSQQALLHLKKCVDDLDVYSKELGNFIYHQQFEN
ncbi:PAS domain S-box protein [Chryseolinea lacunae]|uniref:histidine kinase n=1 Tax=Chryseolinea lacunae TaxID=2801331 RepID=A0ABS1KKQ2_9BACT|nr:PAS domain S-box protein [Chryseolinea lacunae]MBL0740036.1 PAS domain S-box protein [Chryseolinea lacunae]